MDKLKSEGFVDPATCTIERVKPDKLKLERLADVNLEVELLLLELERQAEVFEELVRVYTNWVGMDEEREKWREEYYGEYGK